MATEDNVRTVRATYEAFQRGDIQGVLGSLDPNITWFTPGSQLIPYAGSRQGREQVGRFFAELDATVEFLAFAPQEFLASGDTVIVIGRDRIRVKASNDVIDEEWAHVIRVRDGAIVDFHEFIDTAAVVAALSKATARVL